MQIIQYWALHCCERRMGYLLKCGAKQWNECPAADGIRSVRNANKRCSTADEGGSEHVRVPIMEVLWLPSGHRWPFDPGHGLNVKGHQPGSVGITKTLARDVSPWQHSTHYRRRDGGVLHSVGWNHAHRNTHTYTLTRTKLSITSVCVCVFVHWESSCPQLVSSEAAHSWAKSKEAWHELWVNTLLCHIHINYLSSYRIHILFAKMAAQLCHYVPL